MDLNRLHIFNEVVLSGSFTKAAAKLRQPKSRVSRQIAAFEKELGAQLIYRTTRQFQLTEAGQDLFRRAAPLLTELRHALDQVNVEAEEISGVIRVTAPEDLGVELMGRLSHEFMLLYPKVTLIVNVANAYVDLVKESIDVAVRIGSAKDSTMIQRKLGNVDLVVVASPELLKIRGAPTRLADLEKLPLLSFSPDLNKRMSFRFGNGKESRLVKLDGIFVANNFFTLRQMALVGAGFTFLPAFLAREHIRGGQLLELFKDWRLDPTPLSLLMPQQKETPLKVRKYVEFMSQRLAQLI